MYVYNTVVYNKASNVEEKERLQQVDTPNSYSIVKLKNQSMPFRIFRHIVYLFTYFIHPFRLV